MTASKRGSRRLAEQSVAIIDEIEEYSIEHPDATEYVVETELVAAQILLAMAAMIKLTARTIQSQHDRSIYVATARKYRLAVQHGNAKQLFRDMTEEDQLELHGLKLVVRDPVIENIEPNPVAQAVAIGTMTQEDDNG